MSPRRKETWWWNSEVVAKRKVCYKAWLNSKSAEDKHTLDVANTELVAAVLAAQETRLQEFTADLQRNLTGRTSSGLLDRWIEREEMS